MRKILYLLSSACGLAALLAVTSAGCGGAECADGTVEQDGECVQSSDFDCPEGEVYKESEDGCVPELECGANTELDDDVCVAAEPVDCGPNTELDPSDNTCHTTDSVCEGATAFSGDEDRCVPVEDICQEGTEFDEDARLCYPIGQCQPGDVIVDGYCATELEERASEADYMAEDNTDPEYGGEPVELSIGDLDEETDFTGTIDGPSDLNDDGESDQHRDVFSFEAERGDSFEVSLRALGLPDPAFVIESAEDDGYYERFSADGTGNHKERTILIPEDGHYHIAVVPGAVQKYNEYGVGGEDWDYLGSIAQIEGADPEHHDFDEETLTGTLGDTGDNFFYVDDLEYVEGQLFQFNWEEAPETAEYLLQVWSSPDDYIGEFDGDMPGVQIPESEELYFVVDWQTSYGSYDLDYEIAADSALNLLPGAEEEVVVNADAQDALIVEYDHDSTGSLDVTVTFEDDTVVAEDSITQISSIELLNVEPGEYTVSYENNTDDVFPFFEPHVDAVPPEVESTVEGNEGDLVEISQDNDDFEDLYVMFVHDSTGETVIEDEIDRESLFSYDGPLEYTIDDLEGDYTLYYYEFEPIDGLEVNLDLGALTTIETFDADDDDVVVLSQDNNDSDAIDFWVTHDSSGDVVFEDSLNDGAETHYEIDEHTGTFTVERYDWGDASGLDFQADVVSPEELETVNADDEDIIVLSQENDDDNPLDFWMVHDSSGEIVAEDTVEDEGEFHYAIDEHTGDFTVYWYDFGDNENMDFQADVVSPSVLDTFDAGSNDIVVFFQENNEDADIEFFVNHDSSGETVFEETVGPDEEVFYEPESHTGDFTVYWYDFDEVTGLDFQAQGVSPDTEETATADAWDSIVITQSNGADESIEVIVEHEATGTVVGEGELDHDGELRVNTGDYSGDFSIQYYDFGLAPNVEIDFDVYPPELTETFSADADDGVILHQTNDDDIALDVVVENVSTDEFVYQELPMNADEDYIFNVGDEGGNFQVYWYDYGETDNVDINAEVVPPETIATFEAHTDDLVVLSQDNNDSNPVDFYIQHDSSGEIVLEETLSAGDEYEYVNDTPEGDFSVRWYDFGDAEDLDFTAEVGVPTEATTFSSDGNELYSITQSNSEGNSIMLFIENSDGTIVTEEDLSTSDEIELFVPAGGETYTVYWYDFGDTTDVDISTDEVPSYTAETITADHGDVAILTQTNPEGAEIDIMVVDENGAMVDEAEDFGEDPEGGDVLRLIGLDSADYDVLVFSDDSSLDIEDVDIDVDHQTPEVITDFSATYTGSDLNENYAGPHDYYQFEVSEPVTYDMELTRTSGSGWGEIHVHKVVDEYIDESGYANFTPDNVVVDFEPGETYVLRIGSDWTLDNLFAYEMTFTEE